MKRVYISGPISGHNLEERRNAFRQAQLMLEAQGYETFNPMENGLPPDATTHEHMHRDLAELTREDKPYHAIYLLHRWTHSKGCQVEFAVATAIGLKVIFEESHTFILFA